MREVAGARAARGVPGRDQLAEPWLAAAVPLRSRGRSAGAIRPRSGSPLVTPGLLGRPAAASRPAGSRPAEIENGEPGRTRKAGAGPPRDAAHGEVEHCGHAARPGRAGRPAVGQRGQGRLAEGKPGPQAGEHLRGPRRDAGARGWPPCPRSVGDQVRVHVCLRRRLEVHAAMPGHRQPLVAVSHGPGERHELAPAYGHAAQVAIGGGQGHALLERPGSTAVSPAARRGRAGWPRPERDLRQRR